MSFNHIFDHVILGAGVAGLAIAKALQEKGRSVCLIDTRDIAAGASGTPLGLINPATGRYGTKVWGAEECLNAVTKDMEEIQEKSPTPFFKNTGILRPAQDKEMAERMHENVHKYNWPEGWCEWLDLEKVQEINPNIHCVDGAMWLPKGLTVNVEAYLKAKTRVLESRGLKVKTGKSYQIETGQETTVLKFEDGTEIEALSLIFTSGHETSDSKFWDFLPLHPIKGQVATFESPEADRFDYSLSALGYIASISNSRFVAGSTYEHHFEDIEPDEDGLNYLKERLGGVYPALFKNAATVAQWAGVRASTPNRKPFVGRHPEIDNFYVFTGLGSKGLMYSVYMAEILSDHILNASALPKEISVGRI